VLLFGKFGGLGIQGMMNEQGPVPGDVDY
jgi:hypothetical protein